MFIKNLKNYQNLNFFLQTKTFSINSYINFLEENRSFIKFRGFGRLIVFKTSNKFFNFFSFSIFKHPHIVAKKFDYLNFVFSSPVFVFLNIFFFLFFKLTIKFSLTSFNSYFSKILY